MKKTTLLLAAAWMLLLWFVPQSAKADVDYLREPFTIETTTGSSGTYYIRFYNSSLYSANYTVTINLDYRLKEVTDKNFGDWTTVATANTTTAKGLYDNSIPLAAGKTYIIQFRGINSTGFSKESGATSWAGFLSKKDNYQILPQSSTSDWNVTMYGNIMSLIVGYDTDNEVTAKNTLASENTIPNNYCFTSLFYMHQSYYTGNNASSNISPANYAIIDASNLIFPATTLKTGCYMNLFNNTYSQANGIKYGPTFLVTDLNNAANSGVTDAFRSMFWGCNELKSVRLNLTTCPTQTDNFGSFIYSSSSTGKTLYCPSGFSSCSTCYNSGAGDTSYQWNTSAWSYDPSAEPGGGGGESITPATVNVYQAGTTDTTKILYDLPANAVDLGVGVAWATTDYDASTPSKFAADTRGATGLTGTIFGNNCNCDDPRTQITQNVWYQYSSITPPANWRMPTQAEYEDLTENNTSVINLGTDNKRLQVYSRISNDYIQFSSVGYVLYGCGSSDWWGCYYYNCSWQDINIPYYWITQNSYFGINTSTQVPEISGCDASCMMPARFVYNPSNIHTLTIIAGNHTYIYNCEHGQEVTVTAVPDEMHEFKWWSDDHSNTTATRMFTVNNDMEVKAVFKLDPSIPQHTATFRNWDGTELYQVDVAVGAMPVYEGSTPTKTDWFFNGWSPAISVMGDADVVYTATFRDLESASANVNVYQNVSANSTKILHSLNPVTVSGITYTPIDLGYGVAWADKNLGATKTTDAGNYYKWGATTTTNDYSSYAITMTSFNKGDKFSSQYDVATQVLGANWHIPDDEEAAALKANTTINGNQFNSKCDNKFITLPDVGYYTGLGLEGNGYQHYWLNKYAGKTKQGEYVSMAFVKTESDNNFYVYNKDYTELNLNYARFGMPVRAIYQPTYTTYTLTINVGSYSYQYICQSGQEVTVTANANEGYEFDEWKMENGTTTDATDTHLATRTFVMTGDITRTATFKEAPSVSTYTVHFLAGEGSGTMSDQEINVGELTNLNANTFTAPTATITYDYQGATGGNSKETDVVTAEFDSWYDEDSETSYNDEDEVTDLAAADETVTLTAQWMYNTITLPTPTKTGYTFAGWEDEDGGSHDGDEMFFPEKSQTFTATWTKATTLDLYDDQDATYYNNIKALNGKTYDVTYHRSTAYTSDNGNARWYTLCLPFDVDQSQLDLNGLTGKVYEYRYAEGSADENDHVTFHFRAVKSPGYMHAGQGYLVKATGDMGPDFTFTGVTLDTDKDTETDVNDLKLNSANAYKESGDIAIVGVLRNGTLSNDDRKVMGLANNKIWYPHSSGNPMPAYRAYFYNPNASASVMPRVRIEVEGEGTTELEVVDGELYDARGNNAGGDVRAPSGAASKYIRNGVLIIERNGVTYDAQGKRL